MHTVPLLGICQGMPWQHLNQPWVAGRCNTSLSLRDCIDTFGIVSGAGRGSHDPGGICVHTLSTSSSSPQGLPGRRGGFSFSEGRPRRSAPRRRGAAPRHQAAHHSRPLPPPPAAPGPPLCLLCALGPPCGPPPGRQSRPGAVGPDTLGYALRPCHCWRSCLECFGQPMQYATTPVIQVCKKCFM